MIEHEFTKEKMDSIKALADTNVKIGEAKGVLEKLKQDEVKYLEEREKKAVETVDRILAESNEVLKEAAGNYESFKTLLNTANTFTEYLHEAQEGLDTVINSFADKSRAWEQEVERQMKEMSVLRQEIADDRKRIKNDQVAIEKKQAMLVKEKIKLDDQRATLERAISRLKENRI